MSEQLTGSQVIAQAALARIYRASEREAGVRLSALEVEVLIAQTVLGEICFQALMDTDEAKETA